VIAAGMELLSENPFFCHFPHLNCSTALDKTGTFQVLIHSESRLSSLRRDDSPCGNKSALGNFVDEERVSHCIFGLYGKNPPVRNGGNRRERAVTTTARADVI
jgi:hypothetical protein